MFLPSNITLKLGDSGDFVAELQRRLVNVKAFSEDRVNGFFDGVTVNGVSSFQARCGLRADGIAGPETLRRLNAAVTGGTGGETSGGGGNAEEEQAAKALAAANLRHDFAMEQPQGLSPAPIMSAQPEQPAWGEQRGTMAEAPLAQPGIHDAASMQQAPVYSPDHAAHMLQQQQLQQQMMMQQQMLQHAPLAHQPQPMPPMHAATSELPAQPLAQTPQMASAQPSPQHAASSQAESLARSPATNAQASALPLASTQAAGSSAVAEPAKGLIGRAIEKMDAFVQKLASYFEAKLPPDTLREVKDLGALLAASGVKENPIPAGPEQVRTPSLPARAPEPMQTPQRS